ncbi:MAG: LysM peptidoglycan-binding domain-containing protein [Janthinobacterium lividum]
MGLMDFLNNEGEKKPVDAPQATSGADALFGSTDASGSADANTYTVVSGDSLSKIAKNHYGDGTKWQEIYEANKDLIGNDPNLIEVGQVLTLPSN